MGVVGVVGVVGVEVGVGEGGVGWRPILADMLRLKGWSEGRCNKR